MARCDTCGKECSSDQLVELRALKLCATCKQDAVRDIKSGARPEFCPPTTAEAIRREIRLHRLIGNGLVILFFMGKICRYCSARHPFSREECNLCHAPL